MRLAKCLAVMVMLVTMSPIAIAKNIIVYIDGTGNSPETVDPAKDESVTNIYRLFKVTSSVNQVPIYVRGLATEEVLWDEGFWNTAKAVKGEISNAAGFYFGKGAEQIKNETFKKIDSVFEVNDKLYLFGFSRGAAIARDLANDLVEKGLTAQSDVSIEMMGLFDCVASFGIPVDVWELKTQRINLGKKLQLPEKVGHVYHAVSIHDTRSGFEPTLVSPRYEEVWFAGTHADIGGGYVQRGMADITLKYMMEKARLHKIDFVESEVVEKYDEIDLMSPGDDLRFFVELEQNKTESGSRDLSVDVYGETSLDKVKIHQSVPYWIRMGHGEYFSVDETKHTIVE